VVGFVGAYFWQTIDVLPVAGLAVRGLSSSPMPDVAPSGLLH
jgi:hypothetical protein